MSSSIPWLALPSFYPEGFRLVTRNILQRQPTLREPADHILTRPPAAECCGEHECDINWSLKMECLPPFLPTCDNHNLQTNVPPPHELRQTVHGAEGGEDRGIGVFHTGPAIPAGTFYGEYCGEVISTDEQQQRHANSGSKTSFYFLALEDKLIIDSTRAGNFTRYINHSCKPNAMFRRWIVADEPRIAIYTIEDLQPNDELTISYFSSGPPPRRIPCNCGEGNCSGWMGSPISSRPPPLRRQPSRTPPAPPPLPSFHETTAQHIFSYTTHEHTTYMLAHPARPQFGPQADLSAHLSGDDIDDFTTLFSLQHHHLSSKHPHSNPLSNNSTLTLNTHLWTSLKANDYAYHPVASWTRHVQISNLQHIFIPIHHPHSNPLLAHWSLMHPLPHARRIHSHNSMRGQCQEIAEQLYGWWSDLLFDRLRVRERRAEWTLAPVRSPLQDDGCSCAVHLLSNYATLASPGTPHPLPPTAHIPALRLWIYQAIIASGAYTRRPPRPSLRPAAGHSSLIPLHDPKALHRIALSSSASSTSSAPHSSSPVPSLPPSAPPSPPNTRHRLSHLLQPLSTPLPSLTAPASPQPLDSLISPMHPSLQLALTIRADPATALPRPLAFNLSLQALLNTYQPLLDHPLQHSSLAPTSHPPLQHSSLLPSTYPPSHQPTSDSTTSPTDPSSTLSYQSLTALPHLRTLTTLDESEPSQPTSSTIKPTLSTLPTLQRSKTALVSELSSSTLLPIPPPPSTSPPLTQTQPRSPTPLPAIPNASPSSTISTSHSYGSPPSLAPPLSTLPGPPQPPEEPHTPTPHPSRPLHFPSSFVPIPLAPRPSFRPSPPRPPTPTSLGPDLTFWIRIAQAATRIGPRAIAGPSLPAALAIAPPSIRTAFSAHTSWQPHILSFSPTPAFLTSPHLLLLAVSHALTPPAPTHDHDYTQQLTIWIALAKRAIRTGILSLSSPTILQLAKHAHPTIRLTLRTHTSYAPDLFIYMPHPSFTSSPSAFLASLIQLALLSETPGAPPLQPLSKHTKPPASHPTL